jgi:hypothetical protein
MMTISSACNWGDDDLSRLIDESKRKRPVEESDLVSKPLNAADVPRALKFLNSNPDYTSYHLLLTVRRHHLERYKKISNATKAQILGSTLKNTRWLNDWGLLSPSGSSDFEAAGALLETGKEALKFLVPILDDAGEAPLSGSEEASISSRYRFRRKDFAYRYVSLIRGDVPSFHAEPKNRDADIDALKAKLK